MDDLYHVRVRDHEGRTIEHYGPFTTADAADDFCAVMRGRFYNSRKYAEFSTHYLYNPKRVLGEK